MWLTIYVAAGAHSNGRHLCEQRPASIKLSARPRLAVTDGSHDICAIGVFCFPPLFMAQQELAVAWVVVFSRLPVTDHHSRIIIHM